MHTLIIVIHPKIQESKINKRWVQELQKYPDLYTIHHLYNSYPDEIIDILAEQRLLEKYEKIVFQFPLYWFSSPPLFKKWMDEVLTYGWAYGSKSPYALAGKKIALAISVGIEEKEYTSQGKYKYSLSTICAPFELTFDYVKADYRPHFAYYGMEQNASDEHIEQSIPQYLQFLQSL